jgi:phage gpG-like protein
MDINNFGSSFEQKIIPPFAERVRRSIAMNFKQEGRPNKWKRSKRAENEGGKTLSLKGILQNSISYRITQQKITYTTNVIYAAIHNFGGVINKTVTVKQHERTIKQAFGRVLDHIQTVSVSSHQRKMNTKIPKRQFMMIQPEDLQYLQKTIEKEM